MAEPSSPRRENRGQGRRMAHEVAKLILRYPQRRSSARYLCHIKALYNQDEKSQHQDETWNMARIIDVSTCGIALVLQRHLIPGTLLRSWTCDQASSRSCIMWRSWSGACSLDR